jgi:hypothetical protein
MTILDGDIVINGVYRFDSTGQFRDQQGSKGDHGAYELVDVLSHEFGHWFGLPDNFGDSTAIMYPYFDPSDTRRRTLSDSDKQALDDLYVRSSATDNKSASCKIGTGGSPHHSGGFVAFAMVGPCATASLSHQSRALEPQPDLPMRDQSPWSSNSLRPGVKAN